MRKLMLVFLLFFHVFAASLSVPAVNTEGLGISATLICEVNPGNGRILVSTNPLIGIDTQESEKLAVNFVSETLNIDMSTKDIIFIFESNNTQSIDGGSAGVSMALCLISELTNTPLTKGVSITGTLNEDGTIGVVGGILPKLNSISQISSVFLVPQGQTQISTYTKTYVSPKPGIYIEEFQALKINVSEYGKEKLGVNVIEVKTISEAEQYFFSETSYLRPRPIFTLPEFEKQERMTQIAKYEIEKAKKAVAETNSSSADEFLQKAINVQEGYHYTQSNFAFLAYVIANPEFKDISSATNELKKQLIKLETSDPYWRAESEMRISWAMFNEDFSPAKKEWLMLSTKMLSLENFTGDVIDIEWVKNLADIKIIEAKSEIEIIGCCGIDISEAKNSLNYAIKSFENEMYFSALYNSLDAIAWARASETSNFVLSDLLSNASIMKDEFSESYRRHAFFLANEGDYKVAAYSLFRAELRQGIFDKSDTGIFSFTFPSFDWKLAIIFILFYYVFKNKKSNKTAVLNQEELMLLTEARANAIKILQKKLKVNEIDEKTYFKLIKELGG